MKFYMAANRLVGTQAEARAADTNFKLHDVPTDKDGLMGYVNGLLTEIDKLRDELTAAPVMQESVVSAPETQPEQSAPPAPETRGAPLTEENLAAAKRKLIQELQSMQTETIEDKLLAATPLQNARFLSCSVSRLGELGEPAFRAWHGFRATADMPVGKKNVRIGGSEERGLRYMSLGMVEKLLSEAA